MRQNVANCVKMSLIASTCASKCSELRQIVRNCGGYFSWPISHMRSPQILRRICGDLQGQFEPQLRSCLAAFWGPHVVPGPVLGTLANLISKKKTLGLGDANPKTPNNSHKILSHFIAFLVNSRNCI